MTLPVEIESRLPEIEAEIVALGAELIELQFRRSGHRNFLTFLVDKQNGITLDECVQVNRRLSDLFDGYELAGQGGFFQQPYSLEVSSPGLDRPMKTEKEFSRAQGEKIRLWTQDAEGKGRFYEARLESVGSEGVELVEKSGKKHSFRWNEIVKGIRDL